MFGDCRSQYRTDKRNRRKPENTKQFFAKQAEAVSHIRQATDLVLVDFGGNPKPQDVILLHRCTHYIIISSDPN